MDRPSRKTKAVNYTDPKDFDDDEDFASTKAPPSKKARDAKQEHEKSSSKSSNQESDSQPTASQKSRKSLVEKLHERDLQAAITLSLLNNANGPATGKGVVQVLVDENTDPTSLLLSNCSVDSATLGLNEITSEKAPALSRQTKVAIKAPKELGKKLTDEDEDYEPKLTPESGSDEDFSEPSESEDEEFTVKKVNKTKKEMATKKKSKQCPTLKKEKQSSKPSKPKSQAAATTPVRRPQTAKLAPKRPASSSEVSTSKPAFSPSPAGGRVPKWNPPGQIGRSPSSSQNPAVKSPGQGLRLGLSRLVRVKPLHPSVASH